MSESSGGSGAPAGRSGPPVGHSGCRISEFARWDRRMLEHERQYLSAVCANKAGLLLPSVVEGILHDITDIDYLLRQMAPRVEVQ